MATLTAKGMAKSITLVVRFKGFKQWSFRLWIATQLIRLAAWVAWVNVEFID